MKTLYVRDANKRPLGVLTYEVRGTTIAYGISICAPQDKWNRRLARTIAEERFALIGLRNPRKWLYGQAEFPEVKDLLTWLAKDAETPRVFSRACANTARALRPSKTINGG